MCLDYSMHVGGLLAANVCFVTLLSNSLSKQKIQFQNKIDWQ